MAGAQTTAGTEGKSIEEGLIGDRSKHFDWMDLYWFMKLSLIIKK